MNLSAREEIAAPADRVFAAVSDYDRLARMAEGRGVAFTRHDTLSAPAPGMCWTARAPVRGQMRDIRSEVTAFAPGRGFTIASALGGIEGTTEVEVTPLGPNRSRLRIAIELRPVTLAGRLLIQPLRLGKGALQERLRIRVAGFARSIEAGVAG
jgi:carbon monoxide dehydrogenase subunit G